MDDAPEPFADQSVPLRLAFVSTEELIAAGAAFAAPDPPK